MTAADGSFVGAPGPEDLLGCGQQPVAVTRKYPIDRTSFEEQFRADLRLRLIGGYLSAGTVLDERPWDIGTKREVLRLLRDGTGLLEFAERVAYQVHHARTGKIRERGVAFVGVDLAALKAAYGAVQRQRIVGPPPVLPPVDDVVFGGPFDDVLPVRFDPGV